MAFLMESADRVINNLCWGIMKQKKKLWYGHSFFWTYSMHVQRERQLLFCRAHTINGRRISRGSSRPHIELTDQVQCL